MAGIVVICAGVGVSPALDMGTWNGSDATGMGIVGEKDEREEREENA